MRLTKSPARNTSVLLGLFLAIPCTLSATVVSTCVAGPAGQSSCWAAVAPNATFLQYDDNDSVAAPVFLNLASLFPGISGGQSITIRQTGLLGYYDGTALNAPILNAAFVGSTNLAGQQLNRLDFTGVTTPFPEGGTPAVSGGTYYGGLPMDILEDFIIGMEDVTVVIPDGAQYLAVGVLDSWYADNGTGIPGSADELGTSVEMQWVPEPSTFVLIGGGLLGLATLRFRRR